MRKNIIRSSALTSAILALLPVMASASNVSGGNGKTVGFVAPLANLANALELAGVSVIIISIVVLITQHILHREDLAGLIKTCVSCIVGGAVILAAGGFMTQVGISTTAALIP